MGIEIVNHQDEVRIDLRKIQNIADILFSHLSKLEGKMIDVAFIDESTMKILNEKFRGEKEPTDVLSFSYINSHIDSIKTNTSENQQQPIFGELLICPKVAFNQAKELKHSFEKEIAILISHGLLHLLGYDDSSEEKAKIMEKKQSELVEKLCSEINSQEED